MARTHLQALLTSTSGAVAPTVALSLVALVAAGGLAFDYARMVSMHSELQNAADQSALAAASQLDGKSGAMTRATSAASGLVTNSTLLSNDGGASHVTIASVAFYQDKAGTQAATDDSDARYVRVTVDGRQVFYALTPIVDLLSSGSIDASAMAGLGSATCKVPPVMMCNPEESTDPDFTVSNYIGKGIRLVANDGSGNYAPGTFGFLDNGAGTGAATVKQLMGSQDIPGDCLPGTGVTTEPGLMASVMDAMNTRFDVYANGLSSACGAGNANCPPSANSRKDVVKKDGGGGCAFSSGVGANGWKIPTRPYLPTSLTPYDATTWPSGGLSPMGYPRDICHALSDTGSCAGGRVGDGVWDRYAYFRSHPTDYPTVPTSSEMATMFGSSQPTRYQVYQYEMDHPARLQSESDGSGSTGYGAPVCLPPGVTPAGAIPDRRRLTVAVINCNAEGVSGKTTDIPVQKWIDVFLVEPSLPRARTEATDIYVEVIDGTRTNGDGTAGQVVQREVPYLVR